MKGPQSRDPVWRAVAIGIVLGAPFTVLGEQLNGGREQIPFWHTVGLIFTAPGVLYRTVTGRDVFATAASMCLYFLVLNGFYAIVVFLFTTSGRLFLVRQREHPRSPP
ncbi:MAG: hypothetical protein ACYC9J_06745 [Sulfuricaulis sp.]